MDFTDMHRALLDAGFTFKESSCKYDPTYHSITLDHEGMIYINTWAEEEGFRYHLLARFGSGTPGLSTGRVVTEEGLQCLIASVQSSSQAVLNYLASKGEQVRYEYSPSYKGENVETVREVWDTHIWRSTHEGNLLCPCGMSGIVTVLNEHSATYSMWREPSVCNPYCNTIPECGMLDDIIDAIFPYADDNNGWH